MSITYDLEEQSAIMDSKIYDFAQSTDYIYLIMSGSVELVVVEYVLQDKKFHENEAINKYKTVYRKKVATKIFQLSDGQYFGDYEIIQGLEKRTTRAVCTSSRLSYYQINKYVD